ncbi:hypothetical protein [Roseivirga misakiensis]|uniref:Macroglobulin domain-containing protein n=1 Tax=Roseivirga misakiensis TaxID=1563681 RepID=A0A1E5T2U4_9BACT|nr:hypothetical protein [Roseivirga misakiensis]OEK05692.1 hypothetical protein BFP71_06095 [Roseivirga misakiensis]
MRFFIVLVSSILLSITCSAQVIEKAHLSTDKDIYAPQDTIWFKGYSFDMLNQLSEASLALHVLMVDGEGNKKTNTSWELTDGITDGYLVAPKLEGKYRIIAVTGQMIGSPAEQAFTKDIFVRSEIADEIEVLGFPKFDTYDPNSENEIDIFTRYSTNNEAPEVKLSYTILNEGKSIKKGRLKTSTEGKVTLNLKELKRNSNKEFTLLIESRDKRLTKPIKLTVPIAVPSKSIDLQFFPEGGNIIAGMVNKVAYKAIDQNGEAFDLKGVILDEKGKMVASSQSFYQGTGSFDLLPNANSAYYFKINEPFKIDSLYRLPEIRKSGIQLSLAKLGGAPEKYAAVKATPDRYGQKGKFIIAKNDSIISSVPFEFSKQENWQIAFNNLGVGVYNLRVTDINNIPLAERLFFANSDNQLNINIETDKKEYAARELVQAKIRVLDEDGFPVEGNFSFAAVDALRTKSPLPEQPNLLAQILLASDLMGHVPTPNFYFSGNEKSEKALDLVMLTNGWRRYEPSIITDPEQITGSLHRRNRKRKLLKDREVVLFPIRGGSLKSFEVDKTGVFRIPSTYLKSLGDSFLITSNKMTERDKFSLIPNQEKRIARSSHLARYTEYYRDKYLQDDNLLFHQEFKLSPDRFQNTLLLGAVIVEDNGKISYAGCDLRDFHFQDPWNTKMVEELDMTDLDILAILKQVNPEIHDIGNFSPDPGKQAMIYDVLMTKGRPIRIQLNCEPMKIIDFVQRDSTITDGQYFVREKLNRIDWGNIESISYNRTFLPGPNRAPDIYFEEITFPIVNINTINDQLIYKPMFNRKFFHSTYQHYTTEFYAPVYETEKQKNDPVPDLRTTIFWKANVITNENGEATISYYNADRPNEIKLTVEGVDSYSRLGFGTLKYQVEEGPVTEGGQ